MSQASLRICLACLPNSLQRAMQTASAAAKACVASCLAFVKLLTANSPRAFFGGTSYPIRLLKKVVMFQVVTPSTLYIWAVILIFSRWVIKKISFLRILTAGFWFECDFNKCRRWGRRPARLV